MGFTTVMESDISIFSADWLPWNPQFFLVESSDLKWQTKI